MKLSETKKLFYGFRLRAQVSGGNKCASLNNSLLLSSRNLGTLREHWRALEFLNVQDPGVLCCKHCWIPDIKTSNLSLCSRCFSKFRDDKRGDSFQVFPFAGFFISLVSTRFFHALLIFPRALVRLRGNNTSWYETWYLQAQWVYYFIVSE